MERTSEVELLKRFRDAKTQKNKVEELFESAKKELADAEAQLIDALVAQDKTATAEYAGLGSAALGKPMLYASCKVDNQPLLINYLQTENRMDLVKETVNPKSLSAFVSELIERGESIPEFISFYLKPKIKLRD
jgi:hypothetical protein